VGEHKNSDGFCSLVEQIAVEYCPGEVNLEPKIGLVVDNSSWILLISGLIAYAVGWRLGVKQNNQSTGQSQAPALDILKERYARGEIGREEFETMRQALAS